MALVVFGSAIWSNTPSDIDVAYTSKAFGPKEEAIVRRWAAERGLPSDIMIDPHRTLLSHTGYISLPVPCDLELQFEVIDGEVEVRPLRYSGISSTIRAYGRDAGQLTQKLTELLGPNRLPRLALVPGPREEGEFDDYVEGLKALRSAIAKAPAWGQVFPNVPFGDFLNRVAEGRPRAVTAYISPYWFNQRGLVVWLRWQETRRFLRRPRHTPLVLPEYEWELATPADQDEIPWITWL